jgi:tRNA 2-selenouridine synthase
MAVQQIPITDFLALADQYPVFDVRSPGEFSHAHIPGANTLPLFTDEERKIVGTSYKQQGKQKAIKLGLDFFGVKMRNMVEQVEVEVVNHWIEKINSPDHHKNKKSILVHCWRGGMRSAGVAWLLDLYGYQVYTLAGGYKAYRNWVLWQFSKEYDLRVLGGYTGSGKTQLLAQLKNSGENIIDLEALANHRGSAFGALGQGEQPKQEMFENLLATNLCKMRNSPFWVEDESQRIGNLNIPPAFWQTMRSKPVFFIDIPFEERLSYIIKEYGVFDKELLTNAILRIQKRLGPLETKTAIAYLQEDNIKGCFSILLAYYDKSYYKGLLNRENLDAILNKIPASSVDTISNTEKIRSCAIVAT